MSAKVWALRLAGDFEHPGAVYLVQCPSEENARTRAAWWMGYRPDVQAVAVQCDPGQFPATRWSNPPRTPKAARS